MERDPLLVIVFIHLCDFNSHAHVERDHRGENQLNLQAISTHTLTWSVTQYLQTIKIFTRNFNSHAHVERDGINYYFFGEDEQISTHTLTWSVTKD